MGIDLSDSSPAVDREAPDLGRRGCIITGRASAAPRRPPGVRRLGPAPGPIPRAHTPGPVSRAPSAHRRLYRAVALYARSLMRAFYRPFVAGQPVPTEGPAILVTNHTNGLADAALVLLTTARPVRFLAKYSIFELPFVGSLARWVGAVPIYRQKDGVDMSRNADAFRAIHATLRSGEAISIFPEGSSETVPSLRPLKTGAARMALGAETDGPDGVGVRIVPVGLIYQQRDRWRSRVDIHVGESFAVEPWVEAYRADERGAVLDLTAAIDAALRAVTLDLADLTDRLLLGTAEELVPADRRSVPERLRALAAGLAWLRRARPREAEALVARLRAVGPVIRRARPRGRLANLALGAGARVALVASLAPWVPPAIVARRLGLAKRPTVDKFVTTTLLISSFLFPLWLALLPLAVGSLVGGAAALGVAAWMLVGAAVGARLWSRRLHARARWRAAVDPAGVALVAAECVSLGREFARLDRLGRRLGIDRGGVRS